MTGVERLPLPRFLWALSVMDVTVGIRAQMSGQGVADGTWAQFFPLVDKLIYSVGRDGLIPQKLIPRRIILFVDSRGAQLVAE